MKISLRIWAVLSLVGCCVCVHLPEEDMNAIQLIENQGYPAEAHPVTTEDGYILGMQRIPHGIHGPLANSKPRPAVLLQHGLGACSTCYINNLWNESIGFILADAGFDVWLGNSRGNVYSQKHVTLTTKDKAFWDFTWSDMAEYDIPAMVDYMLKITGQTQIYYVGHSQGTLIAFAKFSSDVQFSKKIKKYFALAPVATVKHITSPIRLLAPFTSEIYGASSLLGFDGTGSFEWVLKFITPVCDNQLVDNLLCENILFYLLGAENTQFINQTRIPVYIAHNPAGTSMKDVAHFGQMIKSGKFQKYDYGWLKNLVVYHSYDVRKMEVETVLFWSNEDALADPLDVVGLLPLIQHQTNTLLDHYSHIDFVLALNAPTLVYQPIIRIIRETEALHQ